MPRQGSSPKKKEGEHALKKRTKGGTLESYAPLALAAVDWLRANGKLSDPSRLCALGHSGGGLAATRAEQARPGTFRAVRRVFFLFVSLSSSLLCSHSSVEQNQ